ncbi:hypothetical protein ACFGVR_12680 [Mucilaginibacter sp. AW1-3]
MIHNFHIPVLGLAYSIDTPLKVARYGISSVVSIVDDELTERMRKYHCEQNDLEYEPIFKNEPNSRSKRITAYLNLLDSLVKSQFSRLQQMPFNEGLDIDRYFELLPATSLLKQGYELMTEYPKDKQIFQNILREQMQCGAIDVNIMAKVDKMNYTANGDYEGDENTDALAALRGFAESNLNSSVVLSAGMNPRLYSYLETFADFFPDKDGALKKKIILKVSDHRSAFIQAKFLAKKGLWVSEFRVESGLNCGGHAFATDGLLLGPILEEFKVKRQEMRAELFDIYNKAIVEKGLKIVIAPVQRISVQGGIGTASENGFLLDHYHLNGTGWGSTFLLVPETTNVDEQTLQKLIGAGQDDYYISSSSPLGILFNNFRKSSGEEQRLQRIEKGRPGSPCVKKYLCTDTEFTELPICTASREYQHLKIKQLQEYLLPAEEYKERYEDIVAKECLCEGLCASAYIKNDMLKPRESKAVTICPGPNLAYFSRIYTLDEMVKHIYGQTNLLAEAQRPHMFINELNLYIDYLKKDIVGYLKTLNEKKGKYLVKFKDQLQQGIEYYKQLIPQIGNQTQVCIEQIMHDLYQSEKELDALTITQIT